VTGIFASFGGEPFCGPPMTLSGEASVILGGYLLSQSLLATQHSVRDSMTVHALHATFHRAGRAGEPLAAEIEITRDGRAFAARRVVVRQSDRLVMTADLSYHASPNDEAANTLPTPVLNLVPAAVFDPDTAPLHTPTRSFLGYDDFDVRAGNAATTSRAPDGSGSPATTFHPYWLRHRTPLHVGSTQQLAAVAFITDVAVTGSAHPLGTPMRERFGTVTLNHTVWFHAAPKLDDWTLIDAHPIATSAGRALALGSVTNRRGVLLATFMQEALLQP
jgi:acyl-CoA thioesterase II